MDAYDFNILAILQADATTTVAEVAAQIGLSATPCWKRIQKLENAGVIKRRVALVSPEKVGLGVSVHIAIATGDHGVDKVAEFARAVSAMPEVMDFDRLAGEVDFHIRVVVADIAAYDAFYRRLTALMPLKSVNSHVVLQTIKHSTELPLALSPQAERAPAR